MQALECSKGISSAATQRTRFIGACVRGPRRIDSCSARRHLTKLAGSSVDPQPLDALRDACINTGARLIKADFAEEEEEEEETYQDALEEMEDFWQRDGVPPSEFLEALGKDWSSARAPHDSPIKEQQK